MYSVFTSFAGETFFKNEDIISSVLVKLDSFRSGRVSNSNLIQNCWKISCVKSLHQLRFA